MRKEIYKQAFENLKPFYKTWVAFLICGLSFIWLMDVSVLVLDFIWENLEIYLDKTYPTDTISDTIIGVAFLISLWYNFKDRFGKWCYFVFDKCGLFELDSD